MLPPGSGRERLVTALNDAYADGVLSQQTFIRRLDLVFGGPLVKPFEILGDLPTRRPAGVWEVIVERLEATCRTMRHRLRRAERPDLTLLALDWAGDVSEMVIGRSKDCDVVLPHVTVSRRHARLSFRDGAWILQDLSSTNGTFLNGDRVARARLEPGDGLTMGYAQLLVD
jgi:FHA domain